MVHKCVQQQQQQRTNAFWNAMVRHGMRVTQQLSLDGRSGDSGCSNVGRQPRRCIINIGRVVV